MSKVRISLLLTLTLSSIAQAKQAPSTYELVISHLPENIEMTKQCGNTIERQIVHVENGDSTSQGSFHFHSVTSTTNSHDPNSPEDGCSLTITSSEACSGPDCHHNIDFHTTAPFVPVVKTTKTTTTP